MKKVIVTRALYILCIVALLGFFPGSARSATPTYPTIPMPQPIYKAIADQNNPYLYIITGDWWTTSSSLVFINTDTAKIDLSIPIGPPGDLTVDADGDKLYYSDYYTSMTRVINIKTLREEAPLNLGIHVNQIRAGRAGRLIVETRDTDISNNFVHRILDAANGKVLGQIALPLGDYQIDSVNQILYKVYYYYDQPYDTKLCKYDISKDRFDLMTSVSLNLHANTKMVMTQSGKRLIINNKIFDDRLKLTNDTSNIYDFIDISLDGKLAFDWNSIFNLNTGQKISSYPIGGHLLAISRGQKKFIFSDNYGHLVFVPRTTVFAIPDPPGDPVPADGARNVPLSGYGGGYVVKSLSWSKSWNTQSSALYFGSDREKVASATTASEEYWGIDGKQAPSSYTLNPGMTYYWRVEAMGGFGRASSPVWSFSTPSITAEGDLLIEGVVNYVCSTGQCFIRGANKTKPCVVTPSVPWLIIQIRQNKDGTTVTVSADAKRMTSDAQRMPYIAKPALDIQWGDEKITVAIDWQVMDLAPWMILSDRSRPMIYTIQNGLIAFINTQTEKMEKYTIRRPQEYSDTYFIDAAVKPEEKCIYDLEMGYYYGGLANYYFAIDTETGNRYDYGQLFNGAERISSGRPGRIFIEGKDQYNDPIIWTCSTSDPYYRHGEIINSLSGIHEGDGAADPAGKYYYHVNDNGDQSALIKYDVSEDEFKKIQEVSFQAHSQPRSSLILSGDGNRLFWKGVVYDQDLNPLQTLGEEILATTTNGEIAFSSATVYATQSGRKIFALPTPSWAMAVSGDQQKLFIRTDQGLKSFPMSMFRACLPEPLNPTPENQAKNVAPTLGKLLWEANPGASQYDVYFGANPYRVSIATGLDPEYLGSTRQPFMALPTGCLSMGHTYYWRVDAIRDFGIASSQTWSFTIASLYVSGPQADTITPAESVITVSWQSDLATVGSAVRIDLWNHKGFVDTLGIDWNPKGKSSIKFFLPLAPSGNDYYLRASSLWDPALTANSSCFAIDGRAIRLEAPNGGEKWRAATNQLIAWKVNTLYAGTAVRLELWRGTRKISNLGTRYEPDGEGFTYITVPLVETASDYRVRAVSVWNPTIYDESDKTITIQEQPARNAVSIGNWKGYE